MCVVFVRVHVIACVNVCMCVRGVCNCVCMLAWTSEVAFTRTRIRQSWPSFLSKSVDLPISHGHDHVM